MKLYEDIYWAPTKKQGGGWICFKGSPSPPPAPDYAGAAQQTAQGNLEAARAAAEANRVNQVTPYGNLTYSRDPNASTPDGGWTATQTLLPAQQALLDQQNKTSLGLAGLADRGLGYVDQALSNNITAADLPADMVNAGQTGQDALMARFQPQMEQSRKALDAQLANQGITQGSEAYNNAMRTQQQGENDLRSQAALNGIAVGQNAQNQQLQVKTALQNQPVNMLNAVRTGSQVTNPTFTNTPQQATTQGADLLGATAAQGQYNQGLYNAGVGSQNSLTGALGGLGAAGIAGLSTMKMGLSTMKMF
ncbi:Hypothetical protein mma_2196 [Janthinobacterium sp. Marseille]|nr:hypothetical protein [Janthinobacterium sp. Marseille]ABR91433.1 Hypothetical protein mma_2196 [Janthinobacterium sp. Marseille]